MGAGAFGALRRQSGMRCVALRAVCCRDLYGARTRARLAQTHSQAPPESTTSVRSSPFSPPDSSFPTRTLTSALTLTPANSGGALRRAGHYPRLPAGGAVEERQGGEGPSPSSSLAPGARTSRSTIPPGLQTKTKPGEATAGSMSTTRRLDPATCEGPTGPGAWAGVGRNMYTAVIALSHNSESKARGVLALVVLFLHDGCKISKWELTRSSFVVYRGVALISPYSSVDSLSFTRFCIAVNR